MSFILPLITLIQIGVLSFYVPRLFYRFANTEITRFPESDYPLLYTLGTETRLARQRICRLLNTAIGILCASAFVIGLVVQLDAVAWSNIITVFILLQIIPYALSEHWEKQVQRIRAKLPKPPVRKAELAPRRLTNMVNPLAFYSYLAFTIIIISATLYFVATEQIKLTKGLAILAANAGFCIFVVRKILAFLRNPRQDPYAARADEFRKAQFQANACLIAGSMIILSSLFSLFKTLNWLTPDQDFIFVAIFFSLVAQLALYQAARQRLKSLDNSDYSVFQQQAPARH